MFFSSAVLADERHLDFIAALQERGYHDLAIEYANGWREGAGVPEGVKILADYYIGKSLMGSAERVADLDERDEQLQKAREHLEKFRREQPDHARAAEATMDLSQILVERGRVAILQAENPSNAARRNNFLQEARRLFDSARGSFTQARERFEREFKQFPAFIPESEKRQREARSAAQINLMQAHLHLGLVDYAAAQTHNKTSVEYKQALEGAAKTFDAVHTQYRFLLGGQYARMWQAKCFEEMGDLGRAEGFYKELLAHEDKSPAMRALQRHVQFFQIIVLGKRGDHVLAADTAREWLQNHPTERRSEVGIGVQFELAQALLQQGLALPARTAERNRLIAQSMDVLSEVARFDTFYKQPALALQQKYKGIIGSAAAVLTFDRAVTQGDDATSRAAWPDAVAAYTAALKLAKPDTASDQLAIIRYKLGFGHFQLQNYFEAAVLGEHVARQHADMSVAPAAGQVALEAYARAFNDAQRRQQETEFEESRILELAKYLHTKWPKSDEASAARALAAEVHRTRARYADAAEVLAEAVPESPEFALQLARAGEAYWRAYVTAADTPQADSAKLATWLKEARTYLTRGLGELEKSADQKLTPEIADLHLVLGEASLEGGHAAESVQLMQQFVPRINENKQLESHRLRALILLLRSQVVSGNLPQAQETMQAIEKTGKELAQITRVYLDLGRQLQAELERMKARGDAAGADRTRDSYVSFLNQLAARREGQTFATLQWTGEAFVGMGMYAQAAERFREIVNRSFSDPKFLDTSDPRNQESLVQIKLRLVTALRRQNLFHDAWEIIKPLPDESNSANDPLHKAIIFNYDIIMERGLVLQEWGTKEPEKLKTAIDHWAFWGQQMQRVSQKPPQYFELRLNLIRCLLDRARRTPKERDQRLRQAEQQLLYVTKTSTQMGGPALKAQFVLVQQELERQLGRPLGGATAGRSNG